MTSVRQSNVANNYLFGIPAVFIFTIFFNLENGGQVPLIPYSKYFSLVVQIAFCGFVLVNSGSIFIDKGRQKLAFFLGLLIVYSLFTVFYSSDVISDSLRRALLIYIPAMILGACIWAQRNILFIFERVAKIYILYAVLLVLISLVLYLFGSIGSINGYKVQSLGNLSQRVMGIPPFIRVGSLVGNPNAFARSVVLAIPFAFFLHQRDRLSTVSLVMIWVSASIAIFLTLSRAGFVLFVIAAVLLFVLKKSSPAIIIIRSVILSGVLAVACSLIYFCADDIPRLTVSLNGRGVQWDLAVEKFLAAPVFGSGFGVSQHEVFYGSGYSGVHEIANLYLALLVELGIAGLLLFSIFFGAAVYKSFSGTLGENSDRAFNVAIFSVFVMLGVDQLVETQLLRSNMICYLWFFLIFCLFKLKHE